MQSKDTKKKHDYIFMAWDVSVRLLVAANPPRDTGVLSSPSLGIWVQAAKLPPSTSDAIELRELILFLTTVVDRVATSAPRKVTPKDLFVLLPEYRNKATGAHSGPRPDDFYARAFPLLARALPVAWEAGFFLPPGEQLVYVSDIELDTYGTHLARVSLLEGSQSSPDAEGVSVPAEVLPQQVYLRCGEHYRPLYPWVVFRAHEIREQFLLFNASNRGLFYLDCDTGELLNHEALRRGGIAVDDPTQERSGRISPTVTTRIPPVEVPHTEAQEQGTSDTVEHTASYRETASPPAASPRRGKRSWHRAAIGAVLALVALSAFLWSRRRLALADWIFYDANKGEGWLARCIDHQRAGAQGAAVAACERSLWAAEPGSSIRARASLQLAKMQCSQSGIERLRNGSLGIEMLVASKQEPIVLAWDPKKPADKSLKLTALTCAEVGSPSVTTDRKIWFHVALPPELSDGQKDWYVDASVLARRDAPEAFARCISAHQRGVDDNVLSECSTALRTTRVDTFARAALALGERHAAHGRIGDAIEWHLSSLAAYPREAPERASIGRSLIKLCERTRLFDRADGDPRTFKVVSWHWQNRRLAFRNQPGMDSPTMSKEYVERGTCVLATASEGVSDKVEPNPWVEVDVPLTNLPFTHGWMHSDWLEPQ